MEGERVPDGWRVVRQWQQDPDRPTDWVNNPVLAAIDIDDGSLVEPAPPVPDGHTRINGKVYRLEFLDPHYRLVPADAEGAATKARAREIAEWVHPAGRSAPDHPPAD